MASVKWMREQMRNELILGLDGANFSNDLAMQDKLDAIKNASLEPLVELLNDLEKRGVETIPDFCATTYEFVRKEILTEYKKLGVI